MKTNEQGPTSDRLDELSDEVARLTRAARSFADEYPLVTLGTVVFAGWVVGRMLRR